MTDSGSVEWVRSARDSLPVLRDVAYLNTGMRGPLSEVAAKAVRDDIDRELHRAGGHHSEIEKLGFRLMRARAVAARILGVRTEEVALTHHTSDAINIVLWGMPWKRGDELVTTTLEHDAALIPALMLRDRLGVELRVADVGRGERTIEAMEPLISARTRLVVISHVAYCTGAILPIAELAALCRTRGVALLIDGAQTCGVQPVDAAALGVEFYTLSGHKWLCGPEGTGALYVRRDMLDELQSTFCSYHSVEQMSSILDFRMHRDARKFETGTVFYPKWAGFIAGVRWLTDEIGVERVWKRSLQLALHARQALADLPGVEIVTPPGQQSQLVSFSLRAWDLARLEQLVRRLAASDSIFIRSCAGPTPCLRASLAFFNTEEDIEILVRSLAAAM